MNPQQRTVQPAPSQIPDHRLQEMQEQLRKSQEQIQQLQGTINYMAAQTRVAPQPQQPDPSEALFKPEVNQAIDQKVMKVTKQLESQVAAAFNGLADRNDNLEFQIRYGVDTYKQNAPKIEQIRADRQAKGQWLSREEAYKQVYFEENARKPKEKPVNAQELAPQFDPYTQTWMTPQGQQAQAQAPVAPSFNPPVADQTTPAPGKPLDVIPQVQTHQNLNEADFNLPPEGVPAPGETSGPRGQMGPLDLTSDEKRLDEWASKYGGVNF